MHTTTEAVEFDTAHRSLMSMSYGIALDAISGRLPTERERERFEAVQHRYNLAALAIGIDG